MVAFILRRALLAIPTLIFISFIRPGERQALLASVTALGARVIDRQEGDDSEVYHVCFSE